MTPRERIANAATVTAAIDSGALWPAIERLQRVGQVGNGAGIYADVPAFRQALHAARAAIVAAQTLIETTEWPTAEDYDAS